jgi:UDP-N-acetylglucosamine 3-dehydrogenase
MTKKNRMQSTLSQAKTEKSPILALIGCGAIAETYYLPALAACPAILANTIFVDRDKKRAMELATNYRAAHYALDHHDILGQVDGVIVAVPTHLHYLITKDCIASGVPVLCEKPLADSIENARELVNLASEKNVPLAVNYLQRLIPSFAKVKEILHKKSLGEPLFIEYYVGEEFNWPTVSGFYFNAPLSARGVLRDRGAHAIDHICWWLDDKPRLVSSKNDAWGGSDAAAHVVFESGKCRGELKLSWLVSFPCIFKVTCKNGIIEGKVYDYQNLFIQSGNGKKRRIHLQAKETGKVAIARKIIINFIEVIAHGTKPLIGGGDILDSIDFIDECYANAVRFDMPWYEMLEVKH